MRISDWSSDVCSSDLLPVGMAVREHGEIAMREGRLGMRQGLQSDSGIGDDRRAVLARNVAMICNTLGVFALGFAARTGRADLVLRLEPDALRLVRAMVDARLDPERRATVVDVARPGLAPMLKKGRSEEHTSELQSLMRISYAVFCLKQKNNRSLLITYYDT